MDAAATTPAGQAAIPRRAARRPRRTGLYLAVNLMAAVGFAVAALLGGAENPRLLYVVLLFVLCTSPMLYVGQVNGRHAILTVLLFLLFVFYGLPDIAGMFPALAPPGTGFSTGILGPAEAGILLGIGALILGYRVAVRLWRSRPSRWGMKEWRRATIIAAGLVLWLIGIAATWFWQTEIVERYAQTTIGSMAAVGLVLSRMVQPVGIALLAYAYVTSRSRGLLLLMVGVLAVEFVFGFLADSKELAFRSAALLVAGKFLLDGRVPRKWMFAIGLVVVFTFGVFQAYRYEVLQMGGQTRTSAADSLSTNLDRALGSELLEGGLLASGTRSLLSRITLKPTMELVVARVGNDVEYQKGYTVALVLTAFIPRLVWPNKPDSSVGQLFNREFGVSADPDTYISATHLAELYWNFGWPGVAVGMFAIGFLLGWVNSRFALSEGRSLTRFLVLVTTIYLVCLRFEGGIALQYTLWIRSLALIGLLHLLFASVMPRERRPVAEPEDSQCRPAPATHAASASR